jgi:hypothetical protein
LLVQGAFPFCIWQRPAKYFVAGAVIGFHLSIAYFMGLPFFSLVMVACEALIFSDHEYLAALAVARRLGLPAAAAWRRNKLFTRTPAASPAAGSE